MLLDGYTVKPVSIDHSQKDQNCFFTTNYHLMQVKSIIECSKGDEHSAILSTFIMLQFVSKMFVLPILERPFYTNCSVCCFISDSKGHK